MTETNSTDQAAVEPADPTQCSGEEGFCPEHGFHRRPLKQLAPRALALDAPAGQSALERILADADHHDQCANLSKNDEGTIAHSSMAAAFRIAAEHVRRDDSSQRACKDAAASRESERQLQQQIDAQAKEIDRLRDEHRFEQKLSADLRARLKATSDACSDADTALYELRKGEEPYTDERAQPTPAQWIWQWNRATPEQRLDMAGRILQAFDTAERCFLLNHKTEAPRRKDAEAAIERAREVAAWLRRNYPGLDAGQRVLAALEHPKETPDA